MKKPKYVIRARNRLTGEREIVSKPMEKDEAVAKKLEMVYDRAGKKAYTNPKVEVAPPMANVEV